MLTGNTMKTEVMNMIEVGTKVVWGGRRSARKNSVVFPNHHGVVTYVSENRDSAIVVFDDIKDLSGQVGDDGIPFLMNEFVFADSIGECGVYVDHEGLVY